MSQCPCHSGKPYQDCCMPFIMGEVTPQTPEQLMRSRYTAYSQANIDYIYATMSGPSLHNFNREAAQQWSEQSDWLGLEILDAPTPTPEQGIVEFAARYRFNNKLEVLHERSEFRYINGRWYYYNGQTSKVGRNQPCPCGSGHKFKKCCGSQAA